MGDVFHGRRLELEFVDGSSEIEWLRADGVPEDSWATGVERSGFTARMRIFHAMWEHPTASDETRTYDHADRASLRTRFRPPRALRWTTRSRRAGLLRDLTADSVLTGRGLGPSYQPGWKRLRWAYLAAQWEIEFDREARNALGPFSKNLPSRSWPVSIAPPTEGSLDWDSFSRVLDLCTRHSSAERLYRLLPWPIWNRDPFPDAIGAGTPEQMLGSYEPDGSGVNWWPEDHSWLVYTDYDSCTTNILGSEQLIKEMEADTFLETHRLPTFTGRS